jgi:hypothetical protein
MACMSIIIIESVLPYLMVANSRLQPKPVAGTKSPPISMAELVKNRPIVTRVFLPIAYRMQL